MPKVSVEHARMLNDAQHLLVQVSLAVVGHDELWGAIRSAKAAVEQCASIAMRDVDRTTLPQRATDERREDPKARRRNARPARARRKAD